MQEMQEMWIRSLGGEDPLEKEMAPHSSILAWENATDRGAWGATAHGVTKSPTWQATKQHRTQHSVDSHEITNIQMS